MKMLLMAAALALAMTSCSNGGEDAVDTTDGKPSTRGEWRRAIQAEGIDWESQSVRPDWSIDAYQDAMLEVCEADEKMLLIMVVSRAPMLDEVRFNLSHACPDRLPAFEQAIDGRLCEMRRDELSENLGKQYDVECAAG